MRIIITGQTGTQKTTFVKALRRYRLKQKGLDPDTPELTAVCHDACQWFEVEQRRWLGVDFLNFITDYREASQYNRWNASMDNILAEIETQQPKDCFLLFHTTFYRNGHFFSPASWDRLLLFKPDCIITLIDDIYDIWQRIESGPHETHFSLEEILTWRSVEIANASSLALNLRLDPKTVLSKPSSKIPKQFANCFGPRIPHFVMSVKHSLETFHRLIFERNERPLVYASFPITRTRVSQERITDVTAKMIIYQAFIEGDIDIPRHLARRTHDLYFNPPHDEFAPGTMWSLSNAFTSAFKELDPIPQYRATAKLAPFLDARTVPELFHG